MPLVALEILENKIKELLIILKHLKEENYKLKKMLQETKENQVSPEVLYELEKLKQLTVKYKNEKNFTITKLSLILEKINDIIRKEEGKNG